MYQSINDRLTRLKRELGEKRQESRKRERRQKGKDLTQVHGNSLCVFHIEDSTGYVLYVGKGTLYHARRVVDSARQGSRFKKLGEAIRTLEANDLLVYTVIDFIPVTLKDAKKKQRALLDTCRETVIMPHLRRYPLLLEYEDTDTDRDTV